MTKKIEEWIYDESKYASKNPDKIIKYLLENKITLTPLLNKHPFLQGWKEYDYSSIKNYGGTLTNWVKTSNAYYMHNVGLITDKSMLCLDFDPDHHEGVDGKDLTKQLITALGGASARTLYCSKPKSYNLHLFYKNNNNFDFRNTQGKFFDCDIFTHNQTVNVINPYSFKNIDLTKGFIEQMADTPDAIVEHIIKDEKRKEVIRQKIYTKYSQSPLEIKGDAAEWLEKYIKTKIDSGWYHIGAQNTDLNRTIWYAHERGIDYFVTLSVCQKLSDDLLGYGDVSSIVNSVYGK
jgi:hypothetical protein